jgi:hypothetical protein
MHPWMLQQVAEEHRRDLLDQAGRWRLLHRHGAGSSRAVQVASGSRLRFKRRGQPIPSVATAVPAGPSASATYAC